MFCFFLFEKKRWLPGQVNIRPKAAEKKAKNEKINAEQAECASGMDYIFDHVFECESKKDDSGLLAVSNKEKLRQEVFKPNRFPYHLYPRTQHYVMWYSSGDETTISAEKVTKDINEEIKKLVDSVDKKDKDKDNYDFVWYFNPKVTVIDVYHAQVLWIANKNDINDDDESDAKTGDEKVPDVGLGLTVDNSTVINGASILRVTVNAPSFDAKESDEDNNEFYAGAPATHTINTNGAATHAPNCSRDVGAATSTTTRTAAPAIFNNDKLCTTGVGLHDFNINECVFNVVFNENEFGNEINNVFDIYFNENFNDNAHYYATPGMVILIF